MIARAALACVVVLFGCNDAQKCNFWGAGGETGATWSECGDKKERKVTCEPRVPAQPDKAVKCTCTVDGIVGKTFETTEPVKLATMESSTSIANEQCGWRVHR
jgi:hypothetical protein